MFTCRCRRVHEAREEEEEGEEEEEEEVVTIKSVAMYQSHFASSQVSGQE